MSEIEVLEKLFVQKRTDIWWKDLLGQDLKKFSDFDDDLALKSLPVAEIEAAAKIHERFKDVFSYIESRGAWYLWDGRIHAPCPGTFILEKVVTEFFYAYGKALDLVDQAVEVKANEIKKTAPEDGSGEDAAVKYKKLMKSKFDKPHRFHDRLGQNAGILAVSRRLQTAFGITPDYYENDRRWFVFENGVMDLEAFKKGNNDCVNPHDPSRNVTKYFAASVTGDNLGYWDKFLEDSIPDPESRRFLQKVVGASFMGICKSRMIVNLFGPPGSGKSTFMDAINKLGHHGVGYCAALDKNAITKTNDQVNFGQNDFKGRRFISISEPDHRSPIDDDFLKNYTGDENVMTRTLHASFESWTPQGILFVASNAPLRINTRDLAIVDRLHMIEFPNSFKYVPGEDESTSIEERLFMDRSRILEWILQGMKMYVDDSMKWNPPQRVIEFRGTVVASASVALRWLQDMIEEGYLELDLHNKKYQGCISVNDAYARFRMWKTFNGERSNLSKSFFEEDITKKYFKPLRYDDKKIFPFLLKTDKYYKEYEAGIPTTEPAKKSTFRF